MTLTEIAKYRLINQQLAETKIKSAVEMVEWLGAVQGQEYAKNNIRVNSILPGSVEDTGTFERSFGGNQASIDWAKSIHPIGRLAKPNEIANAVVFMLSDKAGFLTGHSLLVDGGYTAG